jgi:hypothetical protein
MAARRVAKCRPCMRATFSEPHRLSVRRVDAPMSGSRRRIGQISQDERVQSPDDIALKAAADLLVRLAFLRPTIHQIRVCGSLRIRTIAMGVTTNRIDSHRLTCPRKYRSETITPAKKAPAWTRVTNCMALAADLHPSDNGATDVTLDQHRLAASPRRR